MNESEGRPFGQPEVDLVSKGRMLALTDGVVAIAMTLLVLDIKLPEGLRGAELHQALEEVQSQAGAFLLSAVVIALFWRAHHAALRDAGPLDSYLFWLNVAFLLLLSSIPFPTRVLEDYGDQFLGPGLYGAVIGTAALVLYAMELRTSRTAGVPWRRVPLPAQAVVFLLSVGIARVSPVVAIYSWAAAVPLSMAADRIAARGR
ncbi:TMEM175 family protein [Streptomyces sp. NPDC058430]|uniref:TMEM175 family protein n=1 Tax=unclassified Streptomyces TaxID=2593676 RepID=UPI00363D22E9